MPMDLFVRPEHVHMVIEGTLPLLLPTALLDAFSARETKRVEVGFGLGTL